MMMIIISDLLFDILLSYFSYKAPFALIMLNNYVLTTPYRIQLILLVDAGPLYG